jgi:hypothetical protein
MVKNGVKVNGHAAHFWAIQQAIFQVQYMG